MSLFFQSNQQLSESLAQLPDDYTNDEIRAMVKQLQDDIQSSSYLSFDSLGAKVMHYSENHKKFCLSFPMLFRCIVKGTFTSDMLDVFLSYRVKVKSGNLSDEQAKNNLVDHGVKIIKDRKLASTESQKKN